MRYVLMDALRSGPKHGYEIVKALEERSAGQYVPSPGTVYPTMQYLQDEGFVIADQEGDRRVFRMTDAGKAELDAHAADVEGFWARFEAKGVAQASRHEVTFLEEELESLSRTIWGGLAGAIERGDQEMVRRVRQAVERCREDVRNVISGAA
jgi:DNA-binding PadR family transcriptional regulator